MVAAVRTVEGIRALRWNILVSPYIANKSFATLRNNYYTVLIRGTTRVPVNIHREGNLISEESIFNDVPVLWFIANKYVHTFYSARSRRRRCCVGRSRRGQKFEASLSFSGSLIPTTMAETVRELTWTRKFPLQRTGNIFQRPAKPLQIHAVYDIIACGESFVAFPAYRRFANIKK